MACPVCQAEVVMEAAFCHRCGAPISQTDLATVSKRTGQPLGRVLTDHPPGDSGNAGLQFRRAGDALTPAETYELEALLAEAIANAPDRFPVRRSFGEHSIAQLLLSEWFRALGVNTFLELPFSSGGFSPDAVRFDVVAATQPPLVIEVKTHLDVRDFGQLEAYRVLLDQQGPASLALAVPMHAFPQFVTGVTGTLMAKAMANNVAAILVDAYAMVVFLNHAQLALKEMPVIHATRDSICGF